MESSTDTQDTNHYADFHSSEFGEITDVIWDGDNTIWDWMKYAVESYEAMSQAIADATGKPEPEVAAAMKRFYTMVGTIEDERMIQGLEAEGFFQNVPNFDRDALIDKAQKAFTIERRKHLHVYPGIQKVIQTVFENGINNRILTDAPARQAKARIKRSKIGHMLKQVNAMPSHDPDNLPKKFRDREQQGVYSIDFDITEIPWEKPHTNLEQILKMTREQIRQHVVIIGDNDRKDMELVRRYKCRGIHAVYGETTEDLLKRLLRFAPERVTKKNSSLGIGNESPTINSPSTKEAQTSFDSLQKPNEGLIIKVNDPKEISKILKVEQKRKW